MRLTLPRTCVLLAALSVAPRAGGADEVGPFGPAFGVKADVVRSFTLATRGAVARQVAGKKGDGRTGLRGQCNPARFANFAIEKGKVLEDQVEVSLVTSGKIATGATGEFRLDRVSVRFWDEANGERVFDGKGTLTLTVHQASAGSRRMVGTIRGAKLEGGVGQEGKRLEVEASFDMDFSCGVR